MDFRSVNMKSLIIWLVIFIVAATIIAIFSTNIVSSVTTNGASNNLIVKDEWKVGDVEISKVRVSSCSNHPTSLLCKDKIVLADALLITTSTFQLTCQCIGVG